jgi:hypothetical protein
MTMEDKLRIIQKMHQEAEKPIFAFEPYIKFLPLIFYPPRFDWARVGHCARTSQRLIVIPAYNQNLLAKEGWLRFACLAAFSLLCCRGVEQYAIEILLDEPRPVPNWPEIQCLFGADLPDVQSKLRDLNVRFKVVPQPLTSALIYDYYDGDDRTLLRVDADSIFAREALEFGLFSFAGRLGESGLNYRHTCRTAFDQLFHPDEGRMAAWGEAYRVSADQFLCSVTKLIARVFQLDWRSDDLMAEMSTRHWPSEGLSYIDGSLVGDYRNLRDSLQKENLVPEWDEEVVKLMLSCISGSAIEQARVPVVEYAEHGHSELNHRVINFRNSRTIRPLLERLLTGDQPFRETHLSYVRDSMEEICLAT